MVKPCITGRRNQETGLEKTNLLSFSRTRDKTRQGDDYIYKIINAKSSKKLLCRSTKH